MIYFRLMYGKNLKRKVKADPSSRGVLPSVMCVSLSVIRCNSTHTEKAEKVGLRKESNRGR
jgi:hypothetical protein